MEPANDWSFTQILCQQQELSVLPPTGTALSRRKVSMKYQNAFFILD